MDARTIDTKYQATIDTDYIKALIEKIKGLNNNTTDSLSDILNKNPKQVEDSDKLFAIKFFEGIISMSVFEKDPSIAYSIYNDTSITLEEFIDKIKKNDKDTVIRYKNNLQAAIVDGNIVRIDTNTLYPFEKDMSSARVREIAINASAKNYTVIAADIYTKLMEEEVPFLMDIRLPRDLKKGYMDPIKIDSTSKNFDKILSIVTEVLEKHKGKVLPPSPLYDSIDDLFGYTAVQPLRHSEGFKRETPMEYVLGVLSRTIDEAIRDFRHNYPNVVIDNNNTWAGKMFNLSLIEKKYPDVYMTFLNNVISYLETCKDIIDVKNLFTIPSLTIHAKDIEKLDERLEGTVSSISEEKLDDDIKISQGRSGEPTDFGAFAPSWLAEEATKQAEEKFNDVGLKQSESVDESKLDFKVDKNEFDEEKEGFDINLAGQLNDEFDDFKINKDTSFTKTLEVGEVDESLSQAGEGMGEDYPILENKVEKDSSYTNVISVGETDKTLSQSGQTFEEQQPYTEVSDDFVPVIPDLNDILYGGNEVSAPVGVEEAPVEEEVQPVEEKKEDIIQLPNLDDILYKHDEEEQVVEPTVEEQQPVEEQPVEEPKLVIDPSQFPSLEELMNGPKEEVKEPEKELQVIDPNRSKEDLEETRIIPIVKENEHLPLPSLEELYKKDEPLPEPEKELQVIDVNRPKEEPVDEDEEENAIFNTGAYQLNEIKTTSLNDTEVTSVVNAPQRGETMNPADMAETLGAFKDCLSVEDALTDIVNENGETVTIIDYLKAHHAEELLSKTIDTNDYPDMSGADYIRTILVPLIKQGRDYDKINDIQIVELYEPTPQKVEAKKENFLKGLFHRK